MAENKITPEEFATYNRVAAIASHMLHVEEMQAKDAGNKVDHSTSIRNLIQARYIIANTMDPNLIQTPSKNTLPTKQRIGIFNLKNKAVRGSIAGALLLGSGAGAYEGIMSRPTPSISASGEMPKVIPVTGITPLEIPKKPETSIAKPNMPHVAPTITVQPTDIVVLQDLPKRVVVQQTPISATGWQLSVNQSYYKNQSLDVSLEGSFSLNNNDNTLAGGPVFTTLLVRDTAGAVHDTDMALTLYKDALGQELPEIHVVQQEQQTINGKLIPQIVSDYLLPSKDTYEVDVKRITGISNGVGVNEMYGAFSLFSKMDGSGFLVNNEVMMNNPNK